MLRRRPQVAVPPPRASLIAAATRVQLDGSSWKGWKFGDQKWQEEAWRHYDICGEMRYGANWIGQAVSRCRLFICEVDDAGRPGPEVTDDKIARIAEVMFGGPAGRAEAQRALGINLTVAGEGFVVAEAVKDKKKDIWYTASTSEISRSGERIVVKRSHVFGGGKTELQEGKDLLIRVWTPHPRQHDFADSPTRAVLPILRELEQLTKYVFAQIDSRLAGAGLLLLPDSIDFPRGDDEDPEGIEGFMAVLTRAMSAALTNREDAASLVPVMATVPAEVVDKIKHLTFAGDLTEAAKTLREEAIRRLALGLDMPPEILLGQGDTNHWNAWIIEESSIKIHIVPVLARIADALTTAYLMPALEALKIKDPERYTFWYDTSPLTQKPDRQGDAMTVWTPGLISDQSMRAAGNWSEDDAPDEEERLRRLATDLIKAQPALISDAGLRRLAGLPDDVGQAPAEPGMEALPAEEYEPPPELVDEETPPELPGTTAEQDDAADSSTLLSAAMLDIGADMVVRRALELAGKRLVDRRARVAGLDRDLPAHARHTRMRVLDHAHAQTLLAGAWEHVPALAGRVGADEGRLAEHLRVYCTELLLRGAEHDPDALSMWLRMMMGDGSR